MKTLTDSLNCNSENVLASERHRCHWVNKFMKLLNPFYSNKSSQVESRDIEKNWKNLGIAMETSRDILQRAERVNVDLWLAKSNVLYICKEINGKVLRRRRDGWNLHYKTRRCWTRFSFWHFMNIRKRSKCMFLCLDLRAIQIGNVRNVHFNLRSM